TLYRDKITLNRLTQRQSVNLPLMKQMIKTLLKDVDDMPVLFFENLDNDKRAEVFKNEYWKWTVEQNNMELQDIVDKKQVFMYGRSFDQWQIIDGQVKMTINDPFDIIVDRFVDPTDLHSARYLIHDNIFTPLTIIAENEDYNTEAVNRLIEFYEGEHGIAKAGDNEQNLIDKNERMRDMGVIDIEDPILGESYVELNLHFRFHKEDEEEEQIYLYVIADDMEILMKKPLEEIIGTTTDNFWRDHYPYESWADDVERQDFWSDGIADVVRPSNRVLNAWFSQLVENRTLKNFNMNLFDSTKEGFTPGTFNPVPWGWYPMPGKPSDVWQQMPVADLTGSLDEMEFVKSMAERASGATSTLQGVQTDRQVTLGEVELTLGEAKERIKGMSKFYTAAWKRRGVMFTKLIEAAGDQLDVVKIYKKGKNTSTIFEKEIGPGDWKTKSGYQCKVWSQEEKDTRDTNKLQKLNLAINIMPENKKLREVHKRSVLEFSDLTPDQITDIMEEEQQTLEAPPLVADAGGTVGQAVPPPLAPQPGVLPPPPPPPTPVLPSPPSNPPKKKTKKSRSVKKLKSLRKKIKKNG
ncbi:MAG: hypothetical protein KAS32_08690, partial [Candidatus Peribacteraceae bacterium]|nr:hypothetical protein [Candidatus Peribacteraceae bacterium]